MWVDLAQAAKVSEWVGAGGSGERRASTASIASSAKRGVWCFARSSAEGLMRYRLGTCWLARISAKGTRASTRRWPSQSLDARRCSSYGHVWKKSVCLLWAYSSTNPMGRMAEGTCSRIARKSRRGTRNAQGCCGASGTPKCTTMFLACCGASPSVPICTRPCTLSHVRAVGCTAAGSASTA